MSQIVKLSPTATAGILPLGLIILIGAGARSFHGVARFRTQYDAEVQTITQHGGDVAFHGTSENDAFMKTTSETVARFKTTHECEAFR